MATSPEGLSYIREQLSLGMAKADVAAALAQGGWQPDDIAESFAALENHAPPPPFQEHPVTTRAVSVEPIASAADPIARAAAAQHADTLNAGSEPAAAATVQRETLIPADEMIDSLSQEPAQSAAAPAPVAMQPAADSPDQVVDANPIVRASPLSAQARTPAADADPAAFSEKPRVGETPPQEAIVYRASAAAAAQSAAEAREPAIVAAPESLVAKPRPVPAFVPPVRVAPDAGLPSMVSGYAAMHPETPAPEASARAAGAEILMPKPHHHLLRWIALSIAALLVIAFAAGGAYAYSTGNLSAIEAYVVGEAGAYLPFLSHPPYQGESVLDGVAAGLSQIQASEWDVKIHAFTQARDADASPLPVSDSTSSPETVALQFLTRIAPSDFDATADVNGAAQKTESGADGSASISFDLASEDLTASFAAELRKVGDNLYGIVTKISGLFGGISGIENQWVVVTPQDEDEFGPQISSIVGMPLDLNAARDQGGQDMQKLFAAEEKDHVFAASAPKLVSEGGQTLYRYDLSVVPSAVPAFYADAMQAFADDASSTMHFDQATLDYLKSPEGAQITAYLASNLTASIWADGSGVPVKFEFSLRVVPPADMAKLSGKQVRVVGDLTLSGINKAVAIDVPAPVISADAAYEKVTGTSLMQSMIEQRDSVRITGLSEIVTSLESYYKDHNAYPASLSLISTSTLGSIPVDPLDKSPYPYASTGKSYTLGADLEATTSPSLSSAQGKLLETSCSGAVNGRYCYQMRSGPSAPVAPQSPVVRKAAKK